MVWNTVYIGPYFSLSAAGECFRRFLNSMQHDLDQAPWCATNSLSIMSYPQIDAPYYMASPKESAFFTRASASKRTFETIQSGQPVGVLFVEGLPSDEFLVSIQSKGVQPAIIVLCAPLQDENGEISEEGIKAIRSFASNGVEVIPINDAGIEGTASAFWRPVPIQPAISSFTGNSDVVLFDKTLRRLKDISEKIEKGKQVKVFDPFGFVELNVASTEVPKTLRDKDCTLRSVTAHTREELLKVVEGCEVVIESPEAAFFLGVVGDTSGWDERRTALHRGIVATLAAMFPDTKESATITEQVKQLYKEVPDLPEALKNAETEKSTS